MPSMAVYIHHAGKLRVKHYTARTVTLTAAPIVGMVDLTLLDLTPEQISGLVTLFGHWAKVGASTAKKEVL